MTNKTQTPQRKAQAAADRDVREIVKAIMANVLRTSPSEIRGDKLIREDLGMDSMQAIESLAVLEKELGIIIDPDKAFGVATVNDLFAVVESSLSQPIRNEVK